MYKSGDVFLWKGDGNVYLQFSDNESCTIGSKPEILALIEYLKKIAEEMK